MPLFLKSGAFQNLGVNQTVRPTAAGNVREALAGRPANFPK
jgi:hypothetical protein